MRVALIQDWLTGMRGGERVLEALCGLFPDADIFTLFHHPERISNRINSHRIFVSPLDRLPGMRKHYRNLLPLMPWAIEQFDLRGYDMVISTSHAVAKGVSVPAGIPHFCYCHTPMRLLWSTAGYFHSGFEFSIKRPVLTALKPWLRHWDIRTSAGVTKFLANSQNVRKRIAHAYGRDAEVVYPPVDTEFYTPSNAQPGDYYLVVSALEPYKRVDIAIQSMMRMNRRLIVVGRGTELHALQKIAGTSKLVEFTGWASDEQLRELYRGCRALLFPGLDDFGMCPVEAQACGRPVIAYGQGGALESVIDGVTGLFFREQSVESLITAVQDFEQKQFVPNVARSSSLRFTRARFDTAILAATGVSLELTV